MHLVLPPEDPDLDGASSAFAYAEYLEKNDVKSTAAVFGEPEEDAKEVFEELDIDFSDATYYLYSADDITLVSASSMENISSRIKEEAVVKVIDHTSDSLSDFSEAEQVIDEDYSTAAAIIAKMFRDSETPISDSSASLLSKAIGSADENDSDRDIREWLETHVS